MNIFIFIFSVLVKFYVIDKSQKAINSSNIYEKLTDDGQDFYLGDYRVVRVEESGTLSSIIPNQVLHAQHVYSIGPYVNVAVSQGMQHIFMYYSQF